ncbi:MAG: hypothetical protein A3D34_01200 [Candidatus Staskawiczbacteria bacterium RIFCSPHIGHO2_02_FULL_33_16]|uniref:Phage holin family protein n=1 Tax=Candidatus Staskawiczbacteria bacterium RIFCSPHIGHO2_02_FULL_33_16 TaxID=1802204 RepID=A0A1G2HY58_9BACT|nr:MAG: hypothetical protein A3D34_01200 [Candidatus Staskawiczbacteria bacterium RIFCSPHIGHO2_02_FULL_33_16]OGZ70998.1 MAG: hypothetical protein A2980_03265 [Candidatus Staskawiczbacteria bacterium RIFCSPLOWO2_01_FULL_33_13]
MTKLIYQIVSAMIGLWLAVMFIPGVFVSAYPDSNFFGFKLTALWQVYLLLGVILGLLNFFVKPILDVITLPLRIITLGLFGFAINMGLIWLIDIFFEELNTPLLYPLLWTTLIIFAINIILSHLANKNNN